MIFISFNLILVIATIVIIAVVSRLNFAIPTTGNVVSLINGAIIIIITILPLFVYHIDYHEDDYRDHQ